MINDKRNAIIQKGGVMPKEWMVSKQNLLLQFRDETKQQLQYILDEDPESFQKSVEACGYIINQINALDEQSVPVSEVEQLELKHTLGEILEVREQISRLSPQLYSKLQKGAAAEKQSEQINRAYGNDHFYAPSIFYDKRK